MTFREQKLTGLMDFALKTLAANSSLCFSISSVKLEYLEKFTDFRLVIVKLIKHLAFMVMLQV